MATCIKCGSEGAKSLVSNGNDYGKLCFRCAQRIDDSVRRDNSGCDPRYSDDMETRRMYHALTSAPNSPWRGY